MVWVLSSSLLWWLNEQSCANTTGWMLVRQQNSSKASNPCTLPYSSHPSRIRLQLMTLGNWVLCWGSKRAFGSFTTRNPTCRTLKPRMVTLASKYFDTGITSLLATDNQNKCTSVKSATGFWSKGKIFLVKYPSWMNVTIDAESSKEGTFWPRRSIGTAGHCKTALCTMRCLVSKETTLLNKVWVMSSNLDIGITDNNGSTLVPSPRPLEVGAFSLTHLLIVVVLKMPFAFVSEGNYTCHA